MPETMAEWTKRKGDAISSFLNFLNEQSSNFILKGGTALASCYNLDRFSEDIALDSTDETIKDIVTAFCDKEGYTYRVAKDTPTVKRFMINYVIDNNPLKVEVSYRKKTIDNDEIVKINGINVYNIETLCSMKIAAYSQRDKIRDLYDISFICNNYWHELSSALKKVVREGIEHKGIAQFDYLVRTQGKDELIDIDKLSSDFLELYDRLGLLYSKEELAMIEKDKKRS